VCGCACVAVRVPMLRSQAEGYRRISPPRLRDQLRPDANEYCEISAFARLASFHGILIDKARFEAEPKLSFASVPLPSAFSTSTSRQHYAYPRHRYTSYDSELVGCHICNPPKSQVECPLPDIVNLANSLCELRRLLVT
jgi:hypothetical protein